MKTITLQQLRDADACSDQVKLFEKTFGQSAEVTVEACLAVATLFEFDWAARYLLTAPANKAYREAIAPADKAYDEALATALKAYREARTPARKVYWEAVAPARKAYSEATAPALKSYREAIARAFALAYLSQPD